MKYRRTVDALRDYGELAIVHDELIDVVSPRKGCIDGTLKDDRIVAAIATVVGLFGRILGPAATVAFIWHWPLQFYGPLTGKTASRWQVKKSNPFVDLEAEEDIRDDADILDAEADDDFDDFIDDREVFTDEEQPTKTPLPDKAPGEVDEHLEVDKDL
ncbi:hypothetical protein DXG01_007378, partial [Tephrocybe rancida]